MLDQCPTSFCTLQGPGEELIKTSHHCTCMPYNILMFYKNDVLDTEVELVAK